MTASFLTTPWRCFSKGRTFSKVCLTCLRAGRLAQLGKASKHTQIWLSKRCWPSSEGCGTFIALLAITRRKEAQFKAENGIRALLEKQRSHRKWTISDLATLAQRKASGTPRKPLLTLKNTEPSCRQNDLLQHRPKARLAAELLSG